MSAIFWGAWLALGADLPRRGLAWPGRGLPWRGFPGLGLPWLPVAAGWWAYARLVVAAVGVGSACELLQQARAQGRLPCADVRTSRLGWACHIWHSATSRFGAPL